MSDDTFAGALLECLDETFDGHRGIYLDKGTSLFETLEAITPAEASRSAGARCATLAAQVAYVTFYLEVLERYMSTGNSVQVDWRAIWGTVHNVTPEEWVRVKEHLRETSSRVRGMLRTRKTWDQHAVGGALAILAHTAYHFGSLRQALCAMRSGAGDGSVA